MEKTSARVASRIDERARVRNDAAATAASATITIRILARSCACSFPPEQPGRLHRQDQRHRRVEREIGDLGKQRLAEIVGEPDDQAPIAAPPRLPMPPMITTAKASGSISKSRPGIDAEEGAADDAAECRQEGAERQRSASRCATCRCRRRAPSRASSTVARTVAPIRVFSITSHSVSPMHSGDADHEDAVERQVQAADHDGLRQHLPAD